MNTMIQFVSRFSFTHSIIICISLSGLKSIYFSIILYCFSGVTYRTNGIVQSVLNFIYWQGMLLIAISYTGLLVAGHDSSTNWDHFAGAAWAYMGVIMMSYLLLMSVSIGVDRNAAYSMDHLGHGDKMSHSPTGKTTNWNVLASQSETACSEPLRVWGSRLSVGLVISMSLVHAHNTLCAVDQ